MSDYTDSVDAELAGLQISAGACPGCAECGLEDVTDMEDERYELAGEGHFSWRTCEACGSTFGGDRYPAHGLDDDLEIVHIDVCVDCLMYLANGDEPEAWQPHPS